MRKRGFKAETGEPDVNNGVLAELMALAAEKSEGTLRKAFSRASRAAFLWPEEAAELLSEQRSLTEFPGVGPYMSKVIQEWIQNPPPIPPPPPLRSDFLTLAQSRRLLQANSLPKMRGDLQMHTQWSDGSGTIPEMAEAALQRGYEYIAITDHSKGLKIAGGIDEAAVNKQIQEIRQVNASLRSRGFRVLAGLELNLNPAGEGDMAPECLELLDVVVGSFHSKLRIKEDQTERYLAALRNPHVDILGHPRGRVYNYRLGLQADWGAVFNEAARLGKAVEVDSYPDRQDLNVELLKLARDCGVTIAIDTDAHHAEQLAFAELGLAAAALAGFPSDRVLNFMPREQLTAWLSARRAQSEAA